MGSRSGRVIGAEPVGFWGMAGWKRWSVIAQVEAGVIGVLLHRSVPILILGGTFKGNQFTGVSCFHALLAKAAIGWHHKTGSLTGGNFK